MCINMFLRLVKRGSWTPLGAARLYVGQYEREDAAKALRVRALWNCCCRRSAKCGGRGWGTPPPPPEEQPEHARQPLSRSTGPEFKPLAEQQRDLQAVNQLLNECVEVFRLHRGAPSCGSIEAPDTMAGATRLALSELMVRGSSAWFRRWRVPVSERPSMSLYWWSEGCRRRSRPVERSSRASGATGRSPRRWWLVARDVPNIPCLT